MNINNNFLKKLKEQSYDKFPSNLKGDTAMSVLSLAFTIILISFLGLFAVSPSVSTIIKLRKEISDSEIAHKNLQIKLNNLETLSSKYSKIIPDIKFIDKALPSSPQTTTLAGKIYNVAINNSFLIKNISIGEIELINDKIIKKTSNPLFTFIINAESNNNNKSLDFINDISNFDRIISIKSINISKAAGKANKDKGSADVDIIKINLSGESFFYNK
ncbi:MAG: type 4a pilus biogenesis protein PilO [Candidatus Levybacteria bacterium]|nr:type 4a pilus biogenesis protein PilO [Candidatus Levybacteria bacterium]